MVVVSDLAAFVAERLADDEWTAKAAQRTDDGCDGDWLPADFGAGGFDARVDDHIARHDPARVLREVEAKRKILDEVVPEIKGMDQQIISEWGTSQDVPDAHLPLLKIMASVWSDHPDYQQEWA